MKIIVLSDSHGVRKGITQAFVDHPDAQYAVHLGDGTRDFEIVSEAYPEVAKVSVPGNGEDYFGTMPTHTAIVEIGGKRIMCTHGHRFKAKYTTDYMVKYAAENDADIILFGHTHRPQNEYINYNGKSILLFNPGSCTFRYDANKSYGLIEIIKGQILAGHRYL